MALKFELSAVAIGLALGLLVTGGTSCGPADAACDAKSCGGCCDAEGRCVPGSEDATCGSGGEACETCSAPAFCTGGACQTADPHATCEPSRIILSSDAPAVEKHCGSFTQAICRRAWAGCSSELASLATAYADEAACVAGLSEECGAIDWSGAGVNQGCARKCLRGVEENACGLLGIGPPVECGFAVGLVEGELGPCRRVDSGVHEGELASTDLTFDGARADHFCIDLAAGDTVTVELGASGAPLPRAAVHLFDPASGQVATSAEPGVPSMHFTAMASGKHRIIVRGADADARGPYRLIIGRCSGASCTCPGGLSACPGVCRNLETDATSCGTCGLACGLEEHCLSGTCRDADLQFTDPEGDVAIGFIDLVAMGLEFTDLAIIARLSVKELPPQLTFDHDALGDGYMHYWFGIAFNASSNFPCEGEIRMSAFRFKQPGANEFTGSLADNLNAAVWQVGGGCSSSTLSGVLVNLSVEGNTLTLSVARAAHPALEAITPETPFYFRTFFYDGITSAADLNYPAP